MSNGGEPDLREEIKPDEEQMRRVAHAVAVRTQTTPHAFPIPTTSAALGSDGMVRKTGARAAPWKVLKAEQQSDGWRYQIQHEVTKETLLVAGSNPGYELPAEKALTQEQQDVSAKLRRLLAAPPPPVNTAQWMAVLKAELKAENQKWRADNAKPSLTEKEADEAASKDAINSVSFADIAASPSVSKADVPIVWSGGASDCIIVAGIGNGQARLEHLDNTCVPSFIGFLAQCSKVYLVSEKFHTDPDVAVGNVFVFKTLSALLNKGIKITAVYPAKQLAINSLRLAGSTTFGRSARNVGNSD